MDPVRRPFLLFVAVVLFAIVAGLGLRTLAFYNGMVSDDFVEAAMLEGVYPVPRSPLDLFNFTDGRPDDVQQLMDYGALPWWTVEGLRLAMMRPLASALVIFDREVLGGDPYLAHLHSGVWWILTLLVVATLFWRLLTPPVAALAILVFAFEEGHTLPLSWLANRGALVAMTLGLFGLWCHLRYRVDGWSPGRPLSWVAFALALTCGEWSFPVLGYVLAFELLRDGESWRSRVRAILPAAVPGVAFLIARSALGYGALRSGVYIDPLTEPLDFLVACLQRIPVFFADLLFSVPALWWDFGTPWRNTILSWNVIPADIWVRLPGWRFWHVGLGVTAFALAVLVVRVGLKGAGERERAELRWLLLGAFISLVPMVASFPTSRLVLPASVAASAIAAAVILHGLAYARRRSERLLPRVGVVLLVSGVAYLQLLEAARTSAHDTFWSQHFYSSTRRWVLEADLNVPDIEQRRVILLGSNEHTTAIFGPFARWYYGAPMPRSYWTLTAAPQAFDLYRPKARVLELTVLAGTLLDNDMEKLYRSDKYPFAVGDVVEIHGLRVEILRLLRGKPQRVRFTFDRSLDDPSYLVLNSTIFGLRQVPVPEVGQTVRYKRPAFPDHNVIDVALDFADVNSSCVVRPTIDHCRFGHAFADCGGDGEPVFACHGFGDCRWFVGGCVADGYISSSCSQDDVCCYDGWPFDELDEVFRDGGLRRTVLNTLAGWGRRPFGADQAMNLDVVEEPDLPWAGVELSCLGELGEEGPCDRFEMSSLPRHFASFALSYQPAGHRGGWGLTLEVVRDRSGRSRARVCRIPIARFDAGLCPAEGQPECALAGEVSLNVLPEVPGDLVGVTGRFRADFGGGRAVFGSF